MENQIKCGLFPYIFRSSTRKTFISRRFNKWVIGRTFCWYYTSSGLPESFVKKHLCRYRAGYTKGGGELFKYCSAVQSNGNRACCGKYCNIISKETSQKLAQSAWASLVEILGLLSDGYFYHHSIPGKKVPLLGAKGEVQDSLGGLSINDDWLGNVPCTRFVTLWFCC